MALARHPLTRALSVSCAAHLALGILAVASGLSWRTPPASQQVLVTKLVRLGPPKAKELLPELSQSAQTPPAPVAPAPSVAKPPAAAAAKAPPKAAAPSPKAPRGASQADTRAALQRLRQRDVGDKDGSPTGDTDIAEQGDRYAAEIYRCIKSHYVIEGIEAASVVGKRALVLLYVQGDGRISRHKVVTGSGLAAFDLAVSRAVRQCGKISPPPPAWRTRLRLEGMEIEFQP